MAGERSQNRCCLQSKINSFVYNFTDLNSKINLFTLTIRDKEMQEQYQEARE